ncbi:MAG: hypothetical protein WCA98_12500 [Candidatus Acidiferrales bacterium]
MKPSPGVILAAVIVLLGSAGAILIGVLILVTRVVAPAGLPANVETPATLFLAGAMYVGFGAWGTASGAGLLRLRPWARISMLVFSVFVVAICIFGLAGISMVQFPMPANAPGLDPVLVKKIVAGVFAIPIAVGIWWMLLFTRSSVKEQFGAAPASMEKRYAAPAASPIWRVVEDGRKRRPISITVIACLYLFGAATVPFGMSSTFPTFLFGFILWGHKAAIFKIATFIASAYLGVELLRLEPRARILAICYSLFGIANSFSLVFSPSLAAYVSAFMQSSQSSQSGEVLPVSSMISFMRIGMLGSIAFTVVILWLLIREKPSFETPPKT